MPCHRITLPDGTFAIACTRGSRPARCQVCWQRPHTKLCDGEREPGKTCDKKLCDRCAKHVGPNRDLCPDCAATPAAQPRQKEMF